MANYALLVGIDAYNQNDHDPLQTPVRDVEAVAALLDRDDDGSKRWEVDVLVGAQRSNRQVTQKVLTKAVQQLLKNASADKGHVLFYFAGHAEQLLSGNALVLQGTTRTDPDTTIDLRGLVDLIHGRDDLASATVILDCCYAGGVGNSPDFAIRPDRAILSSSAEEAVDGSKLHSPFATYALECLGGAMAPLSGEVTVTGLFEYVSKRFGRREQRPQLKINLANEPVVLRRGPRVIEPGKLTDLFPRVGAHLTLGWQHEGPEYADDSLGDCYCGGSGHHHGRPAHKHPALELTDDQLEFDELKRLYRHGLIDTRDNRTPFVLIEEGKDLWLSPLGQWYWHQRDLGWM